MAYTPLQYPTPQFAIPRDPSQDIIRAVEMYQKQQGIAQERAMQQQQMQMNQIKIDDAYRKRAEEEQDRKIQEGVMGILKSDPTAPKGIQAMRVKQWISQNSTKPEHLKEWDDTMKKEYDTAIANKNIPLAVQLSPYFGEGDLSTPEGFKKTEEAMRKRMTKTDIKATENVVSKVVEGPEETTVTQEVTGWGKEVIEARKREEQLKLQIHEENIAAQRRTAAISAGLRNEATREKAEIRREQTVFEHRVKQSAIDKKIGAINAAVIRKSSGEDPAPSFAGMEGDPAMMAVLMSLRNTKTADPKVLREAADVEIRPLLEQKKLYQDEIDRLETMGAGKVAAVAEPGAKATDEAGTSGNPLKAAMERKQGGTAPAGSNPRAKFVPPPPTPQQVPQKTGFDEVLKGAEDLMKSTPQSLLKGVGKYLPNLGAQGVRRRESNR